MGELNKWNTEGKPAMSVTTKLTLTDNLPLTCSRSGTRCHGKTVRLNRGNWRVWLKQKD